MQKNIYIDADEEIISILDKIRRENSADLLTLIVPKKAILTQGIINLKILKRESKKLGKEIAISTQDFQAQRVIKRVDIKLTENMQFTKNQDESNFDGEQFNPIENKPETTSITKKQLNAIGSNSFYTQPENTTPTKSSQDTFSIEQNHQASTSNFNQHSSTSPDDKQNHTNPNKDNYKNFNFPKKSPLEARAKTAEIADNDDNYKDNEKKLGLRKVPAVIIGLVFLILGTFFWLKDDYPKVKISITPISKKVKKSIRIIAKASEEINKEENEIHGRIIEVEAKKTIEFVSTGSSFQGDDGKAKGTITIVNNYSNSPQQLVEKTRFLSKEGKLFRLTKAITIPGKKDSTPGKITAQVIADKSGPDFNIGTSTFTIEGFKNNTAKYSKITASSNTTMTGGGAPNQEKQIKTITKDDLKNARLKANEELNKELEKMINEKLAESEKAFASTAEETITEDNPSNSSGTATEKFTYTLKKKARIIAFQEHDVKNLLNEKIRKELSDNFQSKEEMQISYEKGEHDFSKNSLIIDIKTSNIFWKKLNLEEIKNNTSNKDENEIKNTLSDYPGIEKAVIDFTPPQITKFSKTKKKNIIVEESN